MEIIRGAEPTAVARHRDNLNRGFLPHRHQDLQPFLFRHHDVGDNEIGSGIGEQLKPFGAVTGLDDDMPHLVEYHAQGGPERIIVVDEQDAEHGRQWGWGAGASQIGFATKRWIGENPWAG